MVKYDDSSQRYIKYRSIVSSISFEFQSNASSIYAKTRWTHVGTNLHRLPHIQRRFTLVNKIRIGGYLKGINSLSVSHKAHFLALGLNSGEVQLRKIGPTMQNNGYLELCPPSEKPEINSIVSCVKFVKTLDNILFTSSFNGEIDVYDTEKLCKHTITKVEGIGHAAAKILASRGCKIILADCVDGETSKENIIKETGNSNISYKYLDLSSFQNIREFVKDIKKTEKKIDILINNAGISKSEKEITEDGLNFVMQVNYFGSCLLTFLLIDQLKAAGTAQVLFTASMTMYLHELSLENLNITNFEWDTYNMAKHYSNSKLCNVIAAQKFHEKLKNFGVTVNSYDPLGARTNIFKNFFVQTKNNIMLSNIINFEMSFFGLNQAEIAEAILYIVTRKNKINGHYWLRIPMFLPRILKNEKIVDAIWKETEKLIKLTPGESLT